MSTGVESKSSTWMNILDEQCNTIISCVPHKVKADAVFKTFTSKLTNMVPATMLKQHNDFHLFLNQNSASGIITF
jgi:glucosamine-6-phosphate deaminase